MIHRLLAIVGWYSALPFLFLITGTNRQDGGSTIGWTTAFSLYAPPQQPLKRIAETRRLIPQFTKKASVPSTKLFSTPFELDYYEDMDNPFDDNDASKSSSALACSPDTKLVIGLNKYSHDTTLCAANAKTGQVLFAISKERITRQKHDGGNVASMVELCLDTLNLNYDDNVIEKVVMNNHHHRILPLEQNIKHLQWETGLRINGGNEDGYDDEYNLLTKSKSNNFDDDSGNDGTSQQQQDPEDDNYRMELSHHLAHAYSTATQAPFDKGMVVVMDGMGETYRTMLQARFNNDTSYISDLTFPAPDDADGNGFAFDCIPSDISNQAQSSPFDWREAESVYVFEKKDTTMDVRPVFKRFTPENTSPTLYNHGFENMDSAGALYSRASSHIFGDWNACGKVMGLAPWMNHTWIDKGSIDKEKALNPVGEKRRIMWGTLHSENDNKKFQQNKDVLSGLPLIARTDSDLFDAQGHIIPKRRYDFDDYDENIHDSNTGTEQGKQLPTKVALEAISLAYRIQIDLEDIFMDFVKHFKESTGEENLCIAGGVALNSVLNGRLSRELGFKKTYISPYPGDDGIAVGCCSYGLYGNEILDQINNHQKQDEVIDRPPVWKSPLSPYLGPDYSERAIRVAIEAASPWLEVDAVRDENTLLNMVVQEIEIGGVVAWYQGRSELGPRALGHRSILADPRKKGLVRFINQHVKKRESFRPFAPSVLAEYTHEWFDLGGDSDNVSPYMSITAMVKKEKQGMIPAVTHVDGSSRLQTVTREAEPLYHRLISKFFDLTGVPMVLNTSFNTIPGEPIVETPRDAIRSFLSSMGSIEMLVMGDYVIKRKNADLRSLLGEIDKKGENLVIKPACPKRTGPCRFETTFDADDDEMDENSIITHTRVKMPARPMHAKGAAWYQLLDELEGELLSVADGTNTLNDIIAQYTATDESQGNALSEKHAEQTQTMIQNVVHRLVRLYESTLISW